MIIKKLSFLFLILSFFVACNIIKLGESNDNSNYDPLIQYNMVK